MSLETRLDLIFTPDLSLQLFAQPFISSGDFLQYKQLSASESFDFDPFSEGTYRRVDETDTCVGGTTCVDVSGVRYVDFTGDGEANHSFTDRDFNLRSLIGNVVLRWEYRPGSTVFLVWQRSQVEQGPERRHQDGPIHATLRDGLACWRPTATKGELAIFRVRMRRGGSARTQAREHPWRVLHPRG